MGFPPWGKSILEGVAKLSKMRGVLLNFRGSSIRSQVALLRRMYEVLVYLKGWGPGSLTVDLAYNLPFLATPLQFWGKEKEEEKNFHRSKIVYNHGANIFIKQDTLLIGEPF